MHPSKKSILKMFVCITIFGTTAFNPSYLYAQSDEMTTPTVVESSETAKPAEPIAADVLSTEEAPASGSISELDQAYWSVVGVPEELMAAVYDEDQYGDLILVPKDVVAGRNDKSSSSTSTKSSSSSSSASRAATPRTVERPAARVERSAPARESRSVERSAPARSIEKSTPARETRVPERTAPARAAEKPAPAREVAKPADRIVSPAVRDSKIETPKRDSKPETSRRDSSPASHGKQEAGRTTPAHDNRQQQQQGKTDQKQGRDNSPSQSRRDQPSQQHDAIKRGLERPQMAHNKGINSHVGGDLKQKIAQGKKLNGNTYEIAGKNPGEKVRVAQGKDGSFHVTSRVKETRDRNGNIKQENFKYNADGRKTGAVAKGVTRDGKQFERRTTISSNGAVRATTTMVDRNGYRQVVRSHGHGHGYVQRDLGHGRSQRIIIQNNRTIVRNYYNDGWGYRGYSPGYSFAAGFYTGLFVSTVAVWSHNPYYYPYNSWGWHPSPWIYNPWNPYGYYFAPTPYYHSPYYWMYDVVMASTLYSYHRNRMYEIEQERIALRQSMSDRSRYQEQEIQNMQTQISVLEAELNELKAGEKVSKAPPAAEEQTKLVAQSDMVKTNVKQQLSEQIKEEMDAHKAGKSVELSKALQTPGYLFVIQDTDDEINSSYTNEQGQTLPCTLSGGDIIKLDRAVTQAEAADTEKAVAWVRVANSKKGSCPGTSSPIPVRLADLQELKAQFAESVEDSAKSAQAQAGKTLKVAGNVQGGKSLSTNVAASETQELAKLIKGNADSAQEEITSKED